MTIDILLPFYGDPSYMRAAVRSVLDQSSADWRLVVADDCYPDDTIGAWFAELGDMRVHYSRNATNLGANQNYTHVLTRARADWVVVMGADDLMLPDYVARMLEVSATFPEADVVQPGVEVIDEHDRVYAPRADRTKARLRPRVVGPTVLPQEQSLRTLLRGNWTYFPSLCWRRTTIQAIGFRPDFHVVQDLGLLIDVLIRGGGLLLDPEVTFRYRRHAGSDSATKTGSGSRFAEERDYYSQIAAELDAAHLSRAAGAARLHLTSRLHALSLVPTAVRSGRLKSVGELLRHGFTPTRPPASRL